MHYLQITRLLRTSLLAQEPSLKNFLQLEKKKKTTKKNKQHVSAL